MGWSSFAPVVSAGEDVLSKIPILGPLVGAESSEQKALVAQQKRMAEDAKRRQAIVGPARIQAMNQGMAAFGPRNRVMAEVYGPEAAFTGQQISDMTANPMGLPKGDPKLAELDAKLKQYGLDTYEKVRAFNEQTDSRLTDSKGFMAAMKHRQEQDALAAAEKKRRETHDRTFATGPGPATIRPMTAAPVRRY